MQRLYGLSVISNNFMSTGIERAVIVTSMVIFYFLMFQLLVSIIVAVSTFLKHQTCLQAPWQGSLHRMQ